MLIIKPTIYTNFSKVIFLIKLYMFRTVPLSIIRSFSLYTRNGICHTGLMTAFEQDQDGPAVPSWSCSQAVSKPVWHIPLLCVQWKTPDDGQRNCPKHVEFYSKNKLWEISASSWFYFKNFSRCTVTWTSNLSRCTVIWTSNFSRCTVTWTSNLQWFSFCIIGNRRLCPQTYFPFWSNTALILGRTLCANAELQ